MLRCFEYRDPNVFSLCGFKSGSGTSHLCLSGLWCLPSTGSPKSTALLCMAVLYSPSSVGIGKEGAHSLLYPKWAVLRGSSTAIAGYSCFQKVLVDDRHRGTWQNPSPNCKPAVLRSQRSQRRELQGFFMVFGRACCASGLRKLFCTSD